MQEFYIGIPLYHLYELSGDTMLEVTDYFLNFWVMHPVARVPIKHFFFRPPFATIFVV
jgi:hypothetical protein